MNPFKKALMSVDASINKETMYRMVIYGLGGITLIGIIFSFIGIVHFSAIGIIVSLVTLLIVCFVVNKLLAVIFDAQTNHESWLISALILTLILPPAQTVTGAALVALGGVIAMASKYILVYRHRHIFNPAGFAALVLSITNLLPAIWWVGTPLLVIFSVTFGVVLLRKLRQYIFFIIFAAAAIIVALIVGLIQGQSSALVLGALLLSSPLIFFGTIMVTEPETMPNGKAQKWLYAGIVGAIVSSQLHVGPFYATPELALIIGNLFAFVATVGRYKQQVRLKQAVEIGTNLREYVFESNRQIDFKPGQYMELTLPHGHTDKRGNRRTFSIASAPHSNEIRFATKLFDIRSSFKTELENLKVGDVVTIGQLNGSFVLPHDTTQKTVWIAGGIGITPFVSMARDMTTQHKKMDVTLFYLIANASEYAYTEVWKKAEQYGLTVVPILTAPVPDPTWHGLSGSLTPDIIKEYVPDLVSRQFYLSGPHGLVLFFQSTLRKLSLKKSAIHSDFFSGY